MFPFPRERRAFFTEGAKEKKLKEINPIMEFAPGSALQRLVFDPRQSLRDPDVELHLKQSTSMVLVEARIVDFSSLAVNACPSEASFCFDVICNDVVVRQCRVDWRSGQLGQELCSVPFRKRDQSFTLHVAICTVAKHSDEEAYVAVSASIVPNATNAVNREEGLRLLNTLTDQLLGLRSEEDSEEAVTN